METRTPRQYSSAWPVLLLKRLLHTRLGARVGFALGLRGFNSVGAVVVRANPKWYQRRVVHLGFAYNSRVNKGADLIASLVTGAAQNSISSPLPPKYIALADTSTITPDKTDTTLAHETSASGMTRALGTQANYTGPSALDGAASYTVSKTFTAGTSVTIYAAALFDASSSGNLFVEANLGSAAILASSDQLTVTWTVNL